MPSNGEKINDDLLTKQNHINSGISNGFNIILTDSNIECSNIKRSIRMEKSASKLIHPIQVNRWLKIPRELKKCQ
jgi:hypothetical protein